MFQPKVKTNLQWKILTIFFYRPHHQCCVPSLGGIHCFSNLNYKQISRIATLTKQRALLIWPRWMASKTIYSLLI